MNVFELLSIGFIVLCYFWGKAELTASRTKAFLLVAALLPEEERMTQVREYLEKIRKT